MKRKSAGYIIVQIILYIILALMGAVCLYPFLNVFSMSISSAQHVIARDVTFYPKGFWMRGYELVFQNQTLIRSYLNTIMYTVFGTILNVFLTVLAAYPLSRRNFVLRHQISAMITITMYVGGGMIPFFITINQLGLYDNPLGVIIPFAVSAWNIIIARSFFDGIPESLEEAARIDGAGHFTVLLKIMLPISKALIAVLTLYYAVGHWNNYFWPMILLAKKEYQTLQVYLRGVLITGMEQSASQAQIGIGRFAETEQLKYAAIIFTVLPITVVYPFVQKYFIQGVTIGAVKG